MSVAKDVIRVARDLAGRDERHDIEASHRESFRKSLLVDDPRGRKRMSGAWATAEKRYGAHRPPKPSNAQRALIDTGAQASDTRLRRVGLRREPSGAPGEPSGFIGYSGAVMKNRGVYTTPVKSASFKLEIKSDNEASVKGSPPILS